MIRFLRVILIALPLLFAGVVNCSNTTPVVTMDESGMYVTGNAKGEYASELNVGNNINGATTQTIKYVNPIGVNEIFKFAIGSIIGICIVCLISLGGSSKNYAY